LGIRKPYRNGSIFYAWTSFLVIAGYAIPGFLFAILLIVLFAGGSFWSFFHYVGWFRLNGNLYLGEGKF